MANEYFSFDTPVADGTLARASHINDIGEAIVLAFDKLPAPGSFSSGSYDFGVAGGTANALTVDTARGTTESYSDGLFIGFRATATNTGAVTLDVDGVGAASLVDIANSALPAGVLVSGSVYEARYSAAWGKFVLTSVDARLPTYVADAAAEATYAAEWATKAEDSPVSVAAGGDGATTYSAYHWAQKAEAQADASVAAHIADATDAHDASAIGFTPTGNIAATDVQAALAEVDTDKLDKSGGTVSGNLTVGGQLGAASISTAGSISATGNVTGANLNIANWNTAYGWGNWATGVTKAFVDALNVDADTLDGSHASAFQPVDADLTTIAGLSKTDGNFIVANGTAWTAETPTQARASLNVPTRTGGDASGTWPISITGSAGQLDGVDSSQFLRSDAYDVKTTGELRLNDNILLGFGTNQDARMFSAGVYLCTDLNDVDWYIRDGGNGYATRMKLDRANGDLWLQTGNLYFNADNQGPVFGFSQDASIYYTGSALAFNSGSDRMYIRSDGHVLFGSASTTGIFDGSSVNEAVQINTNPGIAIQSNENPNMFMSKALGFTNQYFIAFNYNGAYRGDISMDGTTTIAYNKASDSRLKENIADAQDAGEIIDGLKVRQFDWKGTANHQRYGLVAQEAFEYFPECVSKPKDSDGFYAIDYSDLTPLLLKEVQSLRARVAQLETYH